MNENITFVFYAIVQILSIFLLNRAVKLKKNNKKFFPLFLLSAFLLWFLIVFRASTVGTDYIKVGNTYSKIAMGLEITRADTWFGFGLTILSKIICFIFGKNIFMFFLILGTLTIVFLYKFLYDNFKYSPFILTLFCTFCLYLQTFNQSRQMLALVIILYASKFVKQEKFIKYLITILFASVFHETALIFIPLYFLKNIKINSKIILAYIIIAILFVLDRGIVEFLISKTNYAIYLRTQYNTSLSTSSIFATIVRFIMTLFCFRYYDKSKKDDKLYNYSLHMIMLCVLLNVFAIKYYFFSRLVTYFYAFFFITLPYSIKIFYSKIKSNFKGVAFILLIVFFSIFYSVYYFSSSGASGSGYEQYQFIFLNH